MSRTSRAAYNFLLQQAYEELFAQEEGLEKMKKWLKEHFGEQLQET